MRTTTALLHGGEESKPIHFYEKSPLQFEQDTIHFQAIVILSLIIFLLLCCCLLSKSLI